MKRGIGNRESGIEAGFARGRFAAPMNSALPRNAGEGWGGGEGEKVLVQMLALAPIRPSGTFPRQRGKGLRPKGGIH